MLLTYSRACHYHLLLLTLVGSLSSTLATFQAQNNDFVQDDEFHSPLEYVPASYHKGHPGSINQNCKSLPEGVSIYSNRISSEPRVLDFKERELGVAHEEILTLHNKNTDKNITINSIFGNTPYFHLHFTQEKVVLPLGNATFSVVFLGREEGRVSGYLYIQTSDGILTCEVKAIGVKSPYKLSPVIRVKLPLNATYTPLVHLHNPHNEDLQVTEVLSAGGSFQLELPTGESKGQREYWQIAPHETKPIVKLNFSAHSDKSYTSYIRLRVNCSADVLIVAVDVEVSTEEGLQWEGFCGVLNFGVGGPLEPPARHPVALRNTSKKSVKISRIVSAPVSKALDINYESIVIPGGTDSPVAVGTLTYDWKAGLNLQHSKGQLVITGVNPEGSSQKLIIPWVAISSTNGGMEANVSMSCCSFTSIRASGVINDSSLDDDAINTPELKNKGSVENKFERRVNIFTLLQDNKFTDDKHMLKLESSDIVRGGSHHQAKPLTTIHNKFDGKLRVIIPGEDEDTQAAMNFGTVSSDSEIETKLALENVNPMKVELQGWGVNIPGAVLELIGCLSGPTTLFYKGIHNVSLCSHTGSQNIRPGYLAIFKLKVKTPVVEENTYFGDAFIKTPHERLTIPIFMRVAHGKISIKKLTYTNCFPGSLCIQKVKVFSSFDKSMQVERITPLINDSRITYLPTTTTGSVKPTINKGDNQIGAIKVDLSTVCVNECYTGLSLDSADGVKWISTASLPPLTSDFDLSLLNERYSRYLNLTGDSLWDNVTLRLDTSEVRDHKFQVNIKLSWPTLVNGIANKNRSSIIAFPLTQVGNVSYVNLKLHNPSDKPVMAQLVMDWAYPQGARLFHSLPNKFKLTSGGDESMTAQPGEFSIEDNLQQQLLPVDSFRNVKAAANAHLVYLRPLESRTVTISYKPLTATGTSAILFVRNNMTIVEAVQLTGRGGHALFKFGNRKPGSDAPLIFELTEKHFKDCERSGEATRKMPNLTVKRSFMARNIGELPIEFHGFQINGNDCAGYGFKVLNCSPFTLAPNTSQKIEIAFTPDFTLSRIKRELLITTSLGESEVSDTEGTVRLKLISTIPARTVETCSRILSRPDWERTLVMVAVGVSCLTLLCVLVLSFLEADKIMSQALNCISRGTSVQPPLDLRYFSHSRSLQSQAEVQSARENKSSNCAATLSSDDSPDWSLMNVVQLSNGIKEAVVDNSHNKSIKIPDWSQEEERRFRIDMEANLKKNYFEGSGNSNNQAASGSGGGGGGGKKKLNKRLDNKTEAPAKNKTWKGVKGATKDDLKVHQKGEKIKPGSQVNNNKKTEIINSCWKQEEEVVENFTAQEDTTVSKKSDVVSMKSSNNKAASKKAAAKRVNSFTMDNNYYVEEVVCEEDDGEKDNKQPKAKKTYASRVIGKQDLTASSHDASKPLKQVKYPPQVKEKFVQKKKAHEKCTKGNSGVSIVKESATSSGYNTSSTVAPPPPLNCWNDNRAKFSDVVARNQEYTKRYDQEPKLYYMKENKEYAPQSSNNLTLSTSSSQDSPTYFTELFYPDETFQDATYSTDFTYRDESYSDSRAFANKHHNGETTDKIFGNDTFQPAVNEDLVFVNSYYDPVFEKELVPYDDFAETDEPLECLEAEDSRLMSHHLWEDAAPLITTEEASQTAASALNNAEPLADTIKDHWMSFDSNWKPLYTKGAVGEERNGVWKECKEPWAAAPWGSTTQAYPRNNSQQKSFWQQESGFNPFQSISNIWSPWRGKKED